MESLNKDFRIKFINRINEKVKSDITDYCLNQEQINETFHIAKCMIDKIKNMDNNDVNILILYTQIDAMFECKSLLDISKGGIYIYE